MDREMESKNAARFVRINEGTATVPGGVFSVGSEGEDDDEMPLSTSIFRRFGGGEGMARRASQNCQSNNLCNAARKRLRKISNDHGLQLYFAMNSKVYDSSDTSELCESQRVPDSRNLDRVIHQG